MGFREVVPPSLQAILQNGLLDRTFEDALVPAFIFDTLADVRPWGGALGSTSIMTRPGLMTPVPTPITGSDATPAAYGFEQYTLAMDQFGSSIDTNMVESAMALASKFLLDNKNLAINAAQTINLVNRNVLFGAYSGGQTWVVSGGAAGATTVVVENLAGFLNAVVNLATTGSNPTEGLTAVATPTLVPVSGAAPLPVTLNGIANTVTGAAFTSGTSGPGTLTLGTALGAALTPGEPVVSSIGPVQIRPNARATGAQLVAGDIATLSTFTSAVTRLRTEKVPRIKGAYTAHVPPQTVEELFQDPAFQRVYTGRADSPAYRNFTLGSDIGDNIEFLGRFAGIDWFSNTEVPTYTNPSGVEVYDPIVVGKGAIVKGPFSEMADLVTQLQAGGTVQVDMIGGVARILRAPLDRLGQVLTSTWSWIGGYTCGTDILTGDSATYKRAVVIEHA